jgi:hypothetical protein
MSSERDALAWLDARNEAKRNDYEAFLRAKTTMAPETGFEVAEDEVNPILKPHQRDIVRWAVRRGRAALFESFGLGKTMQQLEVVRLILTRAGGRGLIVIPLGVRQEFMRDAATLGLTVTFIRRLEEAGETGIYLTNYETVRDGKLDPRAFTVVSLDEAGVLRGFGGTKTFREFMATMAGDDRRRLRSDVGEGVVTQMSMPGELVFDPVSGIGSVPLRALKLGRRGYGVELSPGYHADAVYWLRKEQSDEEVGEAV